MSKIHDGECCVCVACELPIVGDIIRVGGGETMCDACASAYYDEREEWEDETFGEEDIDPRFDYDPGEYEPSEDDCDCDYGYDDGAYDDDPSPYSGY